MTKSRHRPKMSIKDIDSYADNVVQAEQLATLLDILKVANV